MASFRFVLVLAIALCVTPVARGQTEVVKGTVYLAETGDQPRFLYENVRIREKGVLVSSRSRYTDLQGKLLVEEETVYEEGKLRRYRYQQLQVEESGEVEILHGKVLFQFTAQGKKETDDETLEPLSIVPDMVGDLLRDSWPKINGGESVKVRFLLVERVDSIGFKFFRDGERVLAGKPVVDVIMKPSSFLIAALAPKIKITVEKESPHRILEIDGRLPIRIPKIDPPKTRKDWRAIDGRVVFEQGKAP